MVQKHTSTNKDVDVKTNDKRALTYSHINILTGFASGIFSVLKVLVISFRSSNRDTPCLRYSHQLASGRSSRQNMATDGNKHNHLVTMVMILITIKHNQHSHNTNKKNENTCTIMLCSKMFKHPKIGTNKNNSKYSTIHMEPKRITRNPKKENS